MANPESGGAKSSLLVLVVAFGVFVVFGTTDMGNELKQKASDCFDGHGDLCSQVFGDDNDAVAPPKYRLTQAQVRHARKTLKHLPVKPPAKEDAYERSKFGEGWSDDTSAPLSHNGCGTRQDILARDLVHKKVADDGCEVLSGVLPYDPYTGEHNEKFNADGGYDVALDTEHIVALGQAWVTGAYTWSKKKRVRYANSPLVLMMVDPSANRTKGDASAAEWLPPNKSYRCAYIARQVKIKQKFGLWVTKPEKQAMVDVLSDCNPKDKKASRKSHASHGKED